MQILKENRQNALLKYQEYAEVVKKREEKYLKTLKDCYYQLSKGRGIIDVYDAFRTAGLNAKKEPRLAIAPAHLEQIVFHGWSRNGGCFCATPQSYSYFSLPDNIFKEQAASVYISTSVPIIPAQFLPKGHLNRYWLLWEVERWDAVPGDPLLLRKLNKNLFVVLAHWDLTPLEKMLVGGRI